jgi:hypothetical protein
LLSSDETPVHSFLACVLVWIALPHDTVKRLLCERRGAEQIAFLGIWTVEGRDEFDTENC